MKTILFIFIFFYLFIAIRNFTRLSDNNIWKHIPEFKEIENKCLDFGIDPSTLIKFSQWINLILQILFVIIILICCK